MSKVLIASIGNGNPKSERYAYTEATYCRADMPGFFCKTPLVVAALKQMYGIDELILVGTAGSSWGPLYEYIYAEENTYFPKQGDYDEDYHFELLKIYEASFNINERLCVEETQEKLSRLQAAMGNFCRSIVILEYGATPEEQLENLAHLNMLAMSLKDGDVVYFDISHAFRSLPFYELLTVNLAKSILQRDIHIEMVSYAMFEASKLYSGKTPIVDMTQLIELLDWTRAVDEYNRRGSFDLLLDLLNNKKNIGGYINQQMSRKTTRAFKTLVETMSATNHGDLKKMFSQVDDALSNPNKVLEHPIMTIINQIMTQIADYFRPYQDDGIALLLASIIWRIKKGQTILGAVLLIDAVENICLDAIDEKLDDDTARDRVHKKLIRAYTNDKYIFNFINKYNAVRKIRNKLAHAKPIEVQNISLRLENEAVEFLSSYLKYFAPGKPQRELLKELFAGE